MTVSLIYGKNKIKFFLDSKNCGEKKNKNKTENISTMLIYSV